MWKRLRAWALFKLAWPHLWRQRKTMATELASMRSTFSAVNQGCYRGFASAQWLRQGSHAGSANAPRQSAVPEETRNTR